MVATKIKQPHPGFQGSETSWAEVIIYSQGDDPILLASKGAQDMSGRYRFDKSHTLIQVATNKGIKSAGTIQVIVKPSKEQRDTLLDQIVDDDWMDIIFHRHGRIWYTMRGLVDDVRRVKGIGSAGANTTVYMITGRDFQRIFEGTPIWFNRFASKVENVAGSTAMQVWSHIPNIGGTPLETVRGMLLGWYIELEGFGRATWKMPDTMPASSGIFIDDILAGFNSRGFSGVPERVSIDPNLMNPQGNLWQLADEWADPAFLEFFCDIGNNGEQLLPDKELTDKDITMSVFFRDKPFPLSPNLQDGFNNSAPASLPIGKDSPWFKLPLHIIPRQQLTNPDVGRSGSERINAFFLSTQTTQELLRSTPPDMVQPLWDEADIKIHGLRRYDITSKYASRYGDILTLSSLQRSMVRDWYALNPYFLNGTLPLAIGRPEIHVGTRVRIPGDGGDTSQDETYYVENVSNSWVYGTGMKTNLGVTRGWIGTDDSLVKTVSEISDRYKVPNSAVAGQDELYPGYEPWAPS